MLLPLAEGGKMPSGSVELVWDRGDVKGAMSVLFVLVELAVSGPMGDGKSRDEDGCRVKLSSVTMRQ